MGGQQLQDVRIFLGRAFQTKPVDVSNVSIKSAILSSNHYVNFFYRSDEESEAAMKDIKAADTYLFVNAKCVPAA
jgi:hypothetical protein